MDLCPEGAASCQCQCQCQWGKRGSSSRDEKRYRQESRLNTGTTPLNSNQRERQAAHKQIKENASPLTLALTTGWTREAEAIFPTDTQKALPPREPAEHGTTPLNSNQRERQAAHKQIKERASPLTLTLAQTTASTRTIIE